MTAGIARSISIVIPSYRDGLRAMSTARALSSLVLPQGISRKVFVVAQGPDADDIKASQPNTDDGIEVVTMADAKGRAAARNIGAMAAADGNILLFVDADCRPANADYASWLLTAFEDSGVVAAGGPIRGTGGDFWGRYQADSDARRAASPTAGPALTAANLAVRREAFEHCGGFDEHYRGYGFEDRDLLLRLSELGKVMRVPNAVIVHEDSLDLHRVAVKLCEAGSDTSIRFARMHPSAYRASGYAAIDARLRPWLRPLGLLLGPMALRGARRLEPLLHSAWMPYPVAKALVKCVSALAFLYGTTRPQALSRFA